MVDLQLPLDFDPGGSSNVEYFGLNSKPWHNTLKMFEVVVRLQWVYTQHTAVARSLNFVFYSSTFSNAVCTLIGHYFP